MEISDDRDIAKIKDSLNRLEKANLSPGAVSSSDGVRRVGENENAVYRQTFSLDVDRILHSLAYTRYIDKTQVFYLIRNDHITHRVLHVQLVSKIARTIGRFLGLNEDLIEAIALGHDIGHTPFGHDGESHLSKLCEAHGIGTFYHSAQSVQFLDRVERKGRGWNLCLQTLDGILCHDGEIHNRMLVPDNAKTFGDLDREAAAKKQNPKIKLVPMTLEGCVVRFSDTISYIGRDLEDAIRLSLIKRTDIPGEIAERLGNTNGTIVYHLVTDVIKTSFRKDHVAFSPEVSDALRKLKMFNYRHIYSNPKIKKYRDLIERNFQRLFETYLSDIRTGNRQSVIFTGFLSDMSDVYLETHAPEEIVRDFIAGMTDRYFLRQCPETPSPEYEAI